MLGVVRGYCVLSLVPLIGLIVLMVMVLSVDGIDGVDTLVAMRKDDDVLARVGPKYAYV